MRTRLELCAQNLVGVEAKLAEALRESNQDSAAIAEALSFVRKAMHAISQASTAVASLPSSVKQLKQNEGT